MNRVVVLGCAGVGKTSFSRKLAERLDAPHICLDEIWRPEWGPDDLPAFRSLVRELHAGERWISDGNFALATFDLRLPLADVVLWLERPRWLCVFNAIRRLAEPAQFHTWRKLPNVLLFIGRFNRINRPRIERALAEFGPDAPLRRVKSRAEEGAILTQLVNQDFGVGRRRTGGRALAQPGL